MKTTADDNRNSQADPVQNNNLLPETVFASQHNKTNNNKIIDLVQG